MVSKGVKEKVVGGSVARVLHFSDDEDDDKNDNDDDGNGGDGREQGDDGKHELGKCYGDSKGQESKSRKHENIDQRPARPGPAAPVDD